MAQKHTCNRDDCPPQNVSGPKIRCIVCNKDLFLKCFAEPGPKIDGCETMKVPLPKGGYLYSFVSHSAFSCCEEIPATTLKKHLKLPKPPRSSSKSRPSSETADFNAVITELAAIKQIATEANTNTKSILSFTEQQNRTNNTRVRSTITTTPSRLSINQSNTSFAAVLGKPSVQLQSPKFHRSAPQKPQIVPPVRIGTKSTSCGLSIVPKPTIISKPRFEKAIWASRFSPSTTTEEINQFIIENTPVKDPSRFTIHKLVKKDCDLTSLRFVSFKVATNTDDFDILCDPDIWPKGIEVRAFLQSQVLGDFFPNLNEKRNRTESETSLEVDPAKKTKLSPAKQHQLNHQTSRMAPKKQTTPKTSPISTSQKA